MKSIKYAVMALTLGSASAIAADCEQPAAPELPDGGTSSMEQMLAGQKAVKAFQAANVEYMQCLEPTMMAAEGADEQYKAIEAAYNAAVSAEEEVADQFNTEIREYKTANPS